jgi:demethylmenaquinone methyltransferase/2-methoxy-6-polyprenyl-1,4-benzoquinol methylase
MNPSIKPVPRTKNQARESYNKMSRWYDTISGNTEKKYRDLGLNLLAAHPGEHILEIGFGTGHALVTLAQAVGPQGHVTGIDLSDGMVEITHQRLAQANLTERVTLLQGDAASHPFEPGAFDAVFMSFTLELFDTPEIPHVLRACARALRSGGRLGVVALVKDTQPGWPVRLYEWFHDRLPTMVDCRPIFGRAALQEAGFTLEKVESQVMWGLPVEILLGSQP